MNISRYRFNKKGAFSLKDFDPSQTGGFRDKEEARRQLQDNVRRMAELQDRFYAQDREGLLEAGDLHALRVEAAHDMLDGPVLAGGVHGLKNQQQPSAEELDHDYLWRIVSHLPERGNIGIFNRSHYEEVLVGRVHNLPLSQKLPARCMEGDLWARRYRQIRDFERYLDENGYTVLKFFLHISKEEQKKRFLERIDTPEKNWKFSSSDIAERARWNEYMDAYEIAINETATRHAPWYVIPSDKKWFARLLISEIVIQRLEKLDPQYPEVSKEQKAALSRCRRQLTEEEKD